MLFPQTPCTFLHQNARNIRMTVIRCLMQRRRRSIRQRIGIRTPIQQTFKGTYIAVSFANVDGLMTGVCARVDGETTVKDQAYESDVVAVAQ
jgi:hypothetical protein